MDKRETELFHLVLVHGIGETRLVRQEATKYWRTRLPLALILTEFSFSENGFSRSWNECEERAQQLLLAIAVDRTAYEDGARLPIVFLCHELGGALVQQALVLAADGHSSAALAADTACVILCNTPEPAKDENIHDFDDDIKSLGTRISDWSLTISDRIKGVPGGLESCCWAFSAISRHYLVVKVTTDRRNTQSLTGMNFTFHARLPLFFYSPKSPTDLWKFASGDPTTEGINEVILRSVRSCSHEDARNMSLFMENMSTFHSSNYQLELSQPFLGSLDWLMSHQTYRDWHTFGEASPDILYLYGPHGTGSAVIASRLITTLSDTMTDCIIIKYCFSKRDQQTQQISAFYISLISQLLLCQPSLFRRISNITEWVSKRNLSHSNLLRNLVDCLLKGASPRPIICIIYGAHNCTSFPITAIVNLLEESRRRANGVIKLVLFGREHSNLPNPSTLHSCRTIDLSSEEDRNMCFRKNVQFHVSRFILRHPRWEPFRDKILLKLEKSGALIQISIVLKLLETSRILTTRKAMTEVLDKIPWSLASIYKMAFDLQCETFPLSLSDLLQWIVHCVRPLSLQETAVIMGLLPTTPRSFSELKELISLSVVNDLDSITDLFIKVSNSRIYPIHETLVFFLDEHWLKSGAKPHTMILRKCLEYLHVVIPHLHSQPEILENDQRYESSSHPELGFLAYAVTNWPKHLVISGLLPETETMVMEFLKNETLMRSWSHLYHRYTQEFTNNLSKIDTTLRFASRFGLSSLAASAIQDQDNSQGPLEQALDLATCYGHEKIVSLLLDAGAVSDQAVCLAIRQGSQTILQQLLDSGSHTLDSMDRFYRSPLVVASFFGQDRITAYLLEKGVDCNSKSAVVCAPILAAVMSGQTECLQCLIEAGADVKTPKYRGNDAIKMAAAGGFDDMIVLLLQKGVDIDGQNEHGLTAILIATYHGHASTCKLLLNLKASIQIKSNDGKSAIQIAAEGGHLEILKRILSINADLTPDEGDSPKRKASTEMATTMSPDTAKYDSAKDLLSPLPAAAAQGHLDIVCELLKHPTYSSQRSRAVALLVAADSGFADVVARLLDSGISISVTDTEGNTALHLAARNMSSGVLSRLLDPEVPLRPILDIHAKNDAGWIPIHSATKAGNLLAVRNLLASGTRIEDKTRDNQTLLHICSQFGHKLVLDELLFCLELRPGFGQEMLVMADDYGNTPLTLAVQWGHIEIVKALIEARPKPLQFQPDLKALHFAIDNEQLAEHGYEEKLVQILLEAGWDVDAIDRISDPTALHLAVYLKKLSMVRLLLRHNADVNGRGVVYKRGRTKGNRVTPINDTPLHIAIGAGVEMIRTLLQAGANIDSQDGIGRTALYLAAYSGLVEIVEELLVWKPNLECRAKSNDWTALHAAYDNKAITKLLLDAGANPYAATSKGTLALFLAAEDRDDPQIIQYYLEQSVDVNFKGPDGFSALHYAARGGSSTVVGFLLKCGADVNIKSNDGVRPIHLAAHFDRLSVVEALVEEGANIEVHCKDYGTPIMAAASRARIRTIQYLLTKGADVNATSEEYALHTALQAAARYGDSGAVDTIDALLLSGAKANIYGGTYGSALCAAAESDHASTERLLKTNVDINYADGKKGTALEIALICRITSIVDLILEHNPNVNVVSNGPYGTALIAAIVCRDTSSVKKLLKHNANPNLTSPTEKETPAQVAIRNGSQNVLEVLLEAGAVLKYKDYLGRGPIAHAIYHRNTQIIGFLWDNGIRNIDDQDDTGGTALMQAISQGSNVVKDLYEKNPQLDVQDQWGRTVLTIAIAKGYSSSVYGLLDRRANPFLKDKRGRDALYWAALSPNTGIFKRVLREFTNAGTSTEPSYRNALHAAITARRHNYMESLCEEITHTADYVNEDGWTYFHTASMYNDPVSSAFLLRRLKSVAEWTDDMSSLDFPSRWNPVDMAWGMTCHPQPCSITTGPLKGVNPEITTVIGMARADHPMVPVKNGVYYFEVTISNPAKDVRGVGVGFCEEHAALDQMLGWGSKAWGYHGDDGKKFGDEQNYGDQFGPLFKDGDTIGCGVNFEKRTAFYTKGEELIGCAFRNIDGKLYPAVSIIGLGSQPCVITAKFWDKNNPTKNDFVYKGSLTDPKTFEMKVSSNTVIRIDTDTEYETLDDSD